MYLLAMSVPILTILLVLIVCGVLLWLVTTYVPMHPTVKMLFVAVVIIVLVVWLLKAFGVWGAMSNVHV